MSISRTSKRTGRLVGLGMAVVFVIGGLSSCNRSKPVETLEIFVRDRKFEPAYIKAQTGPTVWWINETEEQHVVSFEGFESVEIFLNPGTRRGFAFTEPREYKVYCKIHGFKGRALIDENQS